jgi:hypothetical protein
MRRHQGQASHPAVGIEQFKADKVLFRTGCAEGRKVRPAGTSISMLTGNHQNNESKSKAEMA